MLRVHRVALHGNNMAVMPFPRDCPLAPSLTSLELSGCNMFSLPAQARTVLFQMRAPWQRSDACTSPLYTVCCAVNAARRICPRAF